MLFIFFGTVSDFQYACLDFSLLKKLRERIIQEVGISFYDFAYVEGVSSNHDNFTDPAHLSSKGIELVFNKYLLPEYFISKNNLEAHLRRILEFHLKASKMTL